MVKCCIKNRTVETVKIVEDNAGVFRTLTTLQPGAKFILKLDPYATYREYIIVQRSDTLVGSPFSSDDLLELSEIFIEGPGGALRWKGIYGRCEVAGRISSKFEKALESCNDLENLCEGVKICCHQCNHLFQTYKEGIRKVAPKKVPSMTEYARHYTSLFHKHDRLTKLENFLDSLEYIVCEAKDLLGSCTTELGMVALVVSSRRPPVENDMEVYSDFDLLIRELEWHLDVIEYLIEPSGKAILEWSPTMCRYVLAQKKASGHEKARNLAREDHRKLQSDLEDGSIDIPNPIHDTILKRCKAQDPQSRAMDLNAFEIDHLDLHLCNHRPLGEGAVKRVYEGKWYRQSVAIATIKMYDPDTLLILSKGFKDEVNGLLQVQHPKVVSLFGWAETSDAPAPIKEPGDKDCVQGGYIVTEKMECSLDKLIMDQRRERSKNDSGPFSYSVQIDILLQIVEAMLHVHNHIGVMHRDLKPGNFLVNPRPSPARRDADTYYNVKLIDFGSSKVYVGEDGNTYNVGTTAYGAPEMMKGPARKADRGKYGPSVDVFSFAMTCYHVITGKKPFQGTNASKAIQNEERPEFPYGMPVLPDLRELTEECWDRNPKKRPSFKEIQKRLWNIKMKLALEEFWDVNPKKWEFFNEIFMEFYNDFVMEFQQGNLAVVLAVAVQAVGVLAVAQLASQLLLTNSLSVKVLAVALLAFMSLLTSLLTSTNHFRSGRVGWAANPKKREFYKEFENGILVAALGTSLAGTQLLLTPDKALSVVLLAPALVPILSLLMSLFMSRLSYTNHFRSGRVGWAANPKKREFYKEFENGILVAALGTSLAGTQLLLTPDKALSVALLAAALVTILSLLMSLLMLLLSYTNHFRSGRVNTITKDKEEHPFPHYT